MDNVIGTGVKWYGIYNAMFLFIIAIIGFILVIYGLILSGQDDSNWIPIDVNIDKIDSNNKTSCDKDTTYNRNRRSDLFYCTIYFNYNNKIVSKQISNSVIDYSINKKITVHYDKKNPQNDPEINKILVSKYWWTFLLVGIVLIMIGIALPLFILFNSDAAKAYGVYSLVDNYYWR